MEWHRDRRDRRLGRLIWFLATAFASVSCSVYEESLSRPGGGGAGGAGPGAQDAGSDSRDPLDASTGADRMSDPDANPTGTGGAGTGGGGMGGAGGSTIADAFSDGSLIDGRVVDASSDRTDDAPGLLDRTDGPSADAFDADVDADGSVLADAPRDSGVDGADGGPVVGLVYNLVAKHSGKCMGLLVDLPVGVDGNPIVQWTCDGTAGQRFRLQASGSSYTLTSLGMCATIDTSDASSANQLMTSACSAAALQTFALLPAQRAGYYVLSQPQSNKCIGVEGALTADITNVIAGSCSGAPEQSWQFVVAPSD